MITRRTAMKAMGSVVASLMCPVIKLRKEINREGLLRAFCDESRCVRRYDFDKPFGHGELTYACDGKSLCRSEIANRIEVGERRLPRNTFELWNEHWKQHEQFQYFELPRWQDANLFSLESPYHYGVCPECSNRRICFGDEYPYGRTMLTLERKYDYDIDDNTYRDPKCGLCKGREYDGPWLMNVHGVSMDYSRLKPIAALPNVRVAASRYGAGGVSIIFEADGFQGIAMGVDVT